MRRIVLASVLALAATAAQAQSLEQQVHQQANELAKAKQLLNHADVNVRSAALSNMLQSKDTAMRELAYAVGFSSADDVARAVTLSHRFNETQLLRIELGEGDDRNASRLRESLGGVLNVQVRGYDEHNGRFEVRQFSGSHNGVGEVAGLQVTLSQNACSAKFELDDSSKLRGNVVCGGISLPATIDLF
ncbi:hypothetical protein [Pseudidiomarina woesei]|uniref:Uncharacterized protein n=1 Tax=Pseudidiomarina woesei TaxID=1381080 RepID=A0A0K6GYX7_9GAMM|nr:hypothetical protein [Pseudidiomarina woesei]CUA83936.1 hypothetical protein Ga0061064_0816 [Pseudidiomarina woesei]